VEVVVLEVLVDLVVPVDLVVQGVHYNLVLQQVPWHLVAP